MSDNANVFSFRLPTKYMEWFNEHIPRGKENRHKAMLALVIQMIEDSPDFQLSHDDPLQKMENRIIGHLNEYLSDERESIRAYIRTLIQGNGAVLNAVQNARNEYQSGAMGDTVPDDLIENILEGM